MSLSAEVRAVDPLAASPAATSVESELVRATLDGSARAFEEIVQLHGRRIFNYLNQMTRQAQDAEDLVQQTFVKAYQNLHRFDTSRPLVNWLFTIARRTALNHFRAARRWEEMPEDTPCVLPTPAREAETNDQVENIWEQARRRLSEKEFNVMWLRFGENLSTAETARVAGLTQTHVKILVFRARKRLLERPPQS